MSTGEPPAAEGTPGEPLSWSYAQSVLRPVTEPKVVWSQALRATAVTLAVFVVLGCVGGWLWAVVADPPTFLVTRDNAVMGEVEAGRQFGVDVAFSAIATVGGLLTGSLLGWRFPRAGWVLPVVVAVGGGVAALLTWRIGVALGPPHPASVLSGTVVGQSVPESLDVHARGLLLLWPVAALVGTLASVAAVTGEPRPPRSPRG